jgi:molybdate transport system regulatory protein
VKRPARRKQRVRESGSDPRHARGATKLRVMFGEEIAIGPGKAALLEAIAATGSISATAKQLGMSYRRAWLLVDTMNRCFREPLVASASGGSGGGGAHVTDFGRRVMARFRAMQGHLDRALDADLAAFSDLLADRQR